MRVPPELKYTDSHEWVRWESDGSATVGITDFAQESLTLSEHPESINADAFAAWLFRLQPLDPGATQRLLDAGTYSSDIAQHK